MKKGVTNVKKGELLNAIEEQKQLMLKYETILKELEEDEELNQISLLQSEVDDLKDKLDKLEVKYAKLMDDNISLKVALKEQMIDEKNEILRASELKIKTYFNSIERNNENRLKIIENSAKDRLNKVVKTIREETELDLSDTFRKISELEDELQLKLREKSEKLKREKVNILSEIKEEYSQLREEVVSEETIKKRQKQNDIEVKIGLNVINKIGIILMLLGLTTLMKHTYSNWLNDYTKSIAGLLLGVIFLGLGEWLNSKDKNIFSISMCGAGIGVLYISLFNSYFLLNTVNLTTVLILSILTSSVSSAR